MDLDAVTAAAARDAGGVDAGLLGDFLPMVVASAESGRRLRRRELERCRERGAAAAADGVALRALVDLYLSASWRLWDDLVVDGRTATQVHAAARAVLRATDDGVAALAEGYQLARGDLSRRQESARREVFDALLGGGPGAVAVLGRSADLGLDLSGPHAVLVCDTPGGFEGSASAALLGRLERALQGRAGDTGVLLAVASGLLVLIFAAPDAAAIDQVTGRTADVFGSLSGWRAAVGRPAAGSDGVRMSYDSARDALELAGRLRLPGPVVDAADLVVFRVLLRDREALDDLITTVLGPLRTVRGGAASLLATLEVYYATGGTATETARRLHLSVRAVTYRLARIRELLGVDPGDPAERFALHAAVLGARAVGWPEDS